MYHADEEQVFCLKSSFLKSPEGDAGAREKGHWGTAGLEGRGGLVPGALLPPNGVPTARASLGNRSLPGLRFPFPLFVR